MNTTMNKIQSQPKPLNDKWNLYYHLPHNKQWDLASYKPIAKNIDTAECLISLVETISENIVVKCMLFVMRSGITPMWEDKQNRDGGAFSYKVPNANVMLVWRTLFYSLCGETLSDKESSEKINGITISPKRSFCIIKIWLKDCSVQDPNIIVNILNLSKQGCLFKKHEPEF